MEVVGWLVRGYNGRAFGRVDFEIDFILGRKERCQESVGDGPRVCGDA